MKALKFISAALALCFLALPVWAEVKIKEVVSPGGITAWLVEDHSIPFTALELRFRGGTSLDQPGKRGATYLMAGLLEEGAGGLAAQDYARELESLAARFSYDADRDTVSISAQFLSENRAEAVDLVRAGSAALGGKGGGGRPDMAQAGGPDGAMADAAIEAIKAEVGAL